MKSLNVCLIHSPSITYRESTMNTTCKILEKACQDHHYRLRIFKIQNHEISELKHKTQELEARVNYDKTGDEEFDRSIQTLNLEQMSNFLKHQEALKQIIAISKMPTITKEDLFMVMEDDAMILPEFQKNLNHFLQHIENSSWDLITFSVSKPNESVDTSLLTDVRPITKILPGKEAYLIQPATAEVLMEDLKKIRFTYRFQLSYWIHTHPEIRVLCPNQRITLEGSKVGFMPSTTTENNLLVYNQEFMEMFKMMVNQIPYDFTKIKSYYKIIEHLKSPDAMHLYGVILHREGKLEQAKDLFLEAIHEMSLKNGLISARSELLNNTINIHGLAQEDLTKYRSCPSKYSQTLQV